ncbi:MAG TPA: HEAT repeat domain-containing protein [Bryobacteraceae bacterium]|nr:HEAT repeat domain-containing protein [Bryobacteraceae bacterium]
MKLFSLFFAVGFAFAQNGPPSVVNAHRETRPFSGTLEAQLKTTPATWFGYAIKTTRGDHENCCWNGSGHAGCWLEGGDHTGTISGVQQNRPVQLEGTDTLAVLFRVENQSVERVQVYSLECPLDAGGLPFVWLSGVPAGESIAFLQKLANDQTSNRVMNGAIFALSQHEDPKALDVLIQLAKTSPSPHVREQALFWMAQKAGARAAAAITDAIQNDPNTEVKKRAVFALSQLPKDEGVPKLIDIARTQRNPEVRKQAFFWLGQSKDPRAIAFIEQVLTR